MKVNIDCPVELLNYQLYRSKSTNKVYCALTFNNISDKKVKGLKAAIYCYDQFGDPINSEEAYLECEVELTEPVVANKPFGMEEKIALEKFPNTRKVVVDITKVLFKDQTIWNKLDTELDSVELKEIENLEQLSFVQNNAGEDAKYFSQESKGRWTCVCGRINYDYMTTCSRCGKHRDEVLSKYSDEKTINHYIELYEKGQEELRTKEEDERERQIEIKKQKAKRVTKYLVMALVSFLFIGFFLFGYLTKFTFSMETYWLLKNRDDALVESVKSGNMDQFEFLIQSGADVNYHNSHNESPILVAIKFGSKKMVQQIIRAGASVVNIGDDKDTILHLMIEYGHFDLLQEFIDRGYDVNLRNGEGQTILYTALVNKKLEIAYYLIEQIGIELKNIDIEGNNALQVAIMYIPFEGKLHEMLLESNIDLSEENALGKNSYHTAIVFATRRTIEKMLKYGMDLNHIDETGNNAIHVLITDSDYEKMQLLKFLVEEKVDINAFNDAGESPLYIAIVNNRLPYVELLLEHNANIDNITEEEESAVAVAKEINNEMENVINRYIEEKRKEEELRAEKEREKKEEEAKKRKEAEKANPLTVDEAIVYLAAQTGFVLHANNIGLYEGETADGTYYISLVSAGTNPADDYVKTYCINPYTKEYWDCDFIRGG